MFDQEEYDSYNNPEISELAKLMHEEKDPEKQENYWDQLQEMLPLYKTKLNTDGTFMFEQDAFNYINNAIKEITNRVNESRGINRDAQMLFLDRRKNTVQAFSALYMKMTERKLRIKRK